MSSYEAVMVAIAIVRLVIDIIRHLLRRRKKDDE